MALGLASDAESRHSLAIEMLDVTLGRGEVALASPVVRTDLPDRARLHQLAELAPDAPSDRAAALADLIDDPGRHWRSPWLAACAVYEARKAGSLAAPRQAAEAADPVLRETLEWAARSAAE